MKMDRISYAVKIEPSLAEKVRKYCLEHGVKQGFFVERALKEQLVREEYLEDLLDFKTLRSQEKEAVSFEEYLSKRKR
jgi:HSP90 family molecular chaperone